MTNDMYFRDFLTGLRRRWYFVLAGLLATAALAVGVTQVVPITYTTTSSVLLLPPKSSLGAGGNPYLNLGGLAQALEVLTARVNAAESMQSMIKSHPEAVITVGDDPTTTGPIVLVSVNAPNPGEATELRDQITATIAPALVQMQNQLGIRPYSQITSSVLATDDQPQRELKNLLRAIIVVVALGGSTTVLMTGYLDKRLLARRPRAERSDRGRRGVVAGGPDVDPTAEDSSWWPEPGDAEGTAGPGDSGRPEVLAGAGGEPARAR